MPREAEARIRNGVWTCSLLQESQFLCSWPAITYYPYLVAAERDVSGCFIDVSNVDEDGADKSKIGQQPMVPVQQTKSKKIFDGS